MTRNEKIASLYVDGKSIKELCAMYNVTDNRIRQLIDNEKSKQKKIDQIAENRIKIQTNPSMDLVRDIDTILECLNFNSSTINILRNGIGKNSLTLTEFMDSIISKEIKNMDFFEDVPAFRIKHIGLGTLLKLLKQVTDCHFSKEFDKEFERRIASAMAFGFLK